MAEDDLSDQIMGAFRKFDVNGDGSIEASEIAAVLIGCDPFWNDATVNALICNIDKNNDGCIQYDEFVDWICQSDKKAPAEAAFHRFAVDDSSAQIADAFRKFDTNGDGIIERSELAAVLMNISDVWDEASVDALATSLDKDGDGHIQYDEFVDWICNAEKFSPSEAAFRSAIEKASPSTQSAFESLAHQAVAALSTFNVADAREVKDMKKLNMMKLDVDQVCIAIMHLLAGLDLSVKISFSGRLREASWEGVQKMMYNTDGFLNNLKTLPHQVSVGRVAPQHIACARAVLDGVIAEFHEGLQECEYFSKRHQNVATGLYTYALKIVAYYDTVAPEGHASAAKLPVGFKAVALSAGDASPIGLAHKIAVAFDSITTKDILDLKVMAGAKAGEDAVQVAVAFMHLLAGLDLNSGVAVDSNGRPKDPTKKGALKMISKVPALKRKLQTLTIFIDAGKMPAGNVEGARSVLNAMGHDCSYANMKRTSETAAQLSRYVINVVMYYDAVADGAAPATKAVLQEKIIDGLGSVTRNNLAPLSLIGVPAGVDQVFAAVMHLVARLDFDLELPVDEAGELKDASWHGAQKLFNPGDDELQTFLAALRLLLEYIGSGKLPSRNVEGARGIVKKMGDEFNYDSFIKKSEVAAGLCNYVVYTIMYYDAVAAVG